MESPDHKILLQKAWKDLVEKITSVDVICDYMISALVITVDQSERVLSGTIRSDSVRRLLNLLILRPRESYEQFLKALVETGQKHIHDMMLELTVTEDDLRKWDQSHYANSICHSCGQCDHADEQVRVNNCRKMSTTHFPVSDVEKPLTRPVTEDSDMVSCTEASTIKKTSRSIVATNSLPESEKLAAVTEDTPVFDGSDSLFSVACTNQQELIIGKKFGDRRSIEVFSNDGQSKRKFSVCSSGLFDIAVHEGTVFVSDYKSGNVEVFDKVNGQPMRVVRMRTKGACGMCVIGEWLYVTSEKEDCINRWNINTQKKPKCVVRNVPCPYYLAADDDVLVVSSATCNRVSMYSHDGALFKNSLDQESCCLNSPRGVAVFHGHIYVADVESDRVLKFSKEGNVLDSISVLKPVNLAFDPEGVLYVTRKDSNKLSVVKVH